MTTTAHVVATFHAGNREGDDVWLVVTDYAEKNADGLTRRSFWVPYKETPPPVNAEVTWGTHHVTWAGGSASKSYTFDERDPRLYTG